MKEKFTGFMMRNLAKVLGGTLLLLFLEVTVLAVLNAGHEDGSPATLMMNLVTFLLVLTVILLVAEFLLVPRLLGGATKVPASLEKSGWTLHDDPQLQARILHDFTFDQIHGLSENTQNSPYLQVGGTQPTKTLGGQTLRWRGVSEVATGHAYGKEALAFKNDYLYNEGGVPGVRITVPEFYGMKVVLRNAGIIALKANTVIPHMHLIPKLPIFKHSALQTESEEFNQRWIIDTTRHDHRYAHALLTPSVMSVLLSEDAKAAGHILFHNGYILSIVSVQNHTVESIEKRLRLLSALVDVTPDFLASSFPYAYIDPSVPQWTQVQG